jgi:hypothetical protein
LAKNHKTLIVLNGGAHDDIVAKYAQLVDLEPKLSFPMPYDEFSEDAYSLGSIMTACGCVLPEEIYSAVDSRIAMKYAKELDTLPADGYFFIKDDKVQNIYRPGTSAHDLISMLKSCTLAR